MELLIALLGGLLIATPIAALVALIRTASLRKQLDDAAWEYRNKISDLKREIADLRREQTQLSQPSNQQGNSAAAERKAPDRPISSEPVATYSLSPLRDPLQAVTPSSFDVRAEVISPFQASQQQMVPSPSIPVADSTAEVASAPPTYRLAPAPHLPDLACSSADATRLEPESTPQPEPAPAPKPIFAAQPVYVSVRTASSSAAPDTSPPRKSFSERLRSTLPLEELLGMNLFAKIGIVLLVLGFALLGRVALISMGPAPRVALIYAVAAAMLGGGIWLENKERYRLVGRTGIGGGWALLFFTTYAMHNVAAMRVMSSDTLNCVLMLVVAVAMVAHTLQYKSQLVTGLAFLLAFSTVALSQTSVYALTAGVILAAGIVAIALRMNWYELEVFGILASYANHFYWLYKLFPDGVAGHAFPQFWTSAIILVFYWAIFRVSYVARKISIPRDERTSTVAALLNTMLLLTVMKFQSTHPELAFYALLGLGALEFIFGQLPVTRRRRPAFILLTVVGTMLIFASAPFRFSGNSIALFWMIAAEALLIAGIAQSELLFRRLGLLAGLTTGLVVLYEAWDIVELRQHSDLPHIQDGILLLTCSAVFYLNAHFIRRKWGSLFDRFEATITALHSYIGGATAFLGIWCIFTGDWTAIAWAALMLFVIFGKRYLDDNHLLAQGWFLLVPVCFTTTVINCHLSETYPHHVDGRLITVPVIALVLYLASWALTGKEDHRLYLRTLTLWAATSFLALLAWCEVAPAWVAPVWMALAVAFGFAARTLKIRNFAYQGHVLAVAVGIQLINVNLFARSPIDRYVPFLTCAAALYAVSRFCTLRDATYGRPAAWFYTWSATALLAALAWNESPQLWLTAIWAVFALALALVDRIFDVEEFPYQAHALALLALLRAVTLNLYSRDQWRGVDLRLLTVSILIVVLYGLARWVRMPESVPARHAYTWVGSALVAWLLWSELQPISVAVGLAVFGLVLFELGKWRQQKQISLQAYAALTAAFGRIFFVNLTAATLPGEAISPRIYTIIPIATIFFFVWAQLQSAQAKPEIRRGRLSDLIAYFGTVCVASVLYVETPVEWIVVAWAALALGLVIVAWLLDLEVFLQQAVLLALGIVGRGIAHNIYGGSYFTAEGWRGSMAVLPITCALLFGALPIAFRLQLRYADRPIESFLGRALALNHTEQWFFFAPVVLITLMIAVKMNPGIITLSWGVEGVIVILLGLLVGQRTYRLTGLALLLLCVGKIICLDAWRLNDRDRYITFIVLGGALTLVSTLYGKYRETVRRLL